MKKIRKILSLTLYYVVASKLPNYAFPGGRFYNAFRVFCMRGFLEIGNGCRIMRNVYVGNGSDIKIGNNCRINESCRLDNVIIGNHVMIARESVVLGKSHKFDRLDIPMESQGNSTTAQGKINDDVWLGLRAIVLPGVEISTGCIIGAGSVVTKSTEPNGIYVGVPARLLRKRSN